uniref:Cyclotide vinc-B n=1 Tax=Viola inconspicua TaxID=591090 RepID=CYVNB_VIOIN|nr:RecName: Full=Cyclotide vinc-B [Viola inconspicua]
GSIPACGESCFKGKCYTPGCTCSKYPLCAKN